jgi:hypothetical protein
VGRAERSALFSHVATVIEHLIKLQASPAIAPRTGWQETVLRARSEIERLLEDSPSLRPAVGGAIERELPRARRIAAMALALHGEQPTVKIDAIDYSSEQVLGEWLPNAP